MFRLLPLLALLLASNPLGRHTLVLGTPRTTKQPTALIDMPMTAIGNTIYDARNGASNVCMRATTATYIDAAGLLKTAPANTCRYQDGVLLQEGAATNAILHSEDIVTGVAPTSPWTVQNAVVGNPTLSVVSVANPTGAVSSVARAVFPAETLVNQYSLIYQNIALGTAQSDSVWMRTESGTALVYLVNQGAALAITPCNVTTTWARFSAIYSLGAQIAIGTSTLASWGVPSTCAAATVLIWGAQAEAGIAATSYIPTVASTVTRAADVVSTGICAHSTAETYIDGAGVLQTVAANICRVEEAGLLMEETRIQYLATPETPATQTTASLGTGAYTGWEVGAGTTTFSVGTATAAALPCVATAAAPCIFAITVAGTIVATVAAPVTRFQLEQGAFKTSFIAAAGTRVMDLDVVLPTKTPSWITTGAWYVAFVAKSEILPAAASESYALFTWGVGGANSAWSTIGTFTVRDGSLGLRTIDWTAHVPTDSLAHRYVFCGNAMTGEMSISIDGAVKTSTTAGAGTGKFSAVPIGIFWMGSDSSAAKKWSGWMNSLKVDKGCVL